MVRRTVTGAAEMLDVTQPVVTRLIADLEDRIAISLFERVKGRLVPTPEAALLFEDVHQSLVRIERIANAASNSKGFRLTRLEIAAAPSMALSFLPPAIASFTNDHPETLDPCRRTALPQFLTWFRVVAATWVSRCFLCRRCLSPRPRFWYPPE